MMCGEVLCGEVCCVVCCVYVLCAWYYVRYGVFVCSVCVVQYSGEDCSMKVWCVPLKKMMYARNLHITVLLAISHVFVSVNT